jgi:hypothetical protein
VLLRVLRLDLLGVERRRVGRAGRRQLELDVVVGELAGTEALEVVAADDDADEVRREAADLLDAGLDHAALAARRSGLGHGSECMR